MYDHLAKLDEYLYRERGIHLTMLRHPKGFEYMMFEEEKQKISSIENRQKLGVPLYGNGWPGVRVRWCTGQLKTHLIAKEVNRLKGKYRALHYVGIAADEPKRIKNEQYPLVDWGITEAKALKICYDRGYDWGGLYEIYHRCSCWCCPFQRIDELRKLRHHHPELWQKLRDMDQRAIAQFGHNPLGQFKQNWTVERLEQRFAAEDAQISVFLSSGKDSTSRIRRTDTAIVRSHFFPAAYAGSPCPRPLYAGYESERYCRNGGYHAITGGKIHPCRTAEAAPVLCSTEMDGQSMSISKEKRCLT